MTPTSGAANHSGGEALVGRGVGVSAALGPLRRVGIALEPAVEECLWLAGVPSERGRRWHLPQLLRLAQGEHNVMSEPGVLALPPTRGTTPELLQRLLEAHPHREELRIEPGMRTSVAVSFLGAAELLALDESGKLCPVCSGALAGELDLIPARYLVPALLLAQNWHMILGQLGRLERLGGSGENIPPVVVAHLLGRTEATHQQLASELELSLAEAGLRAWSAATHESALRRLGALVSETLTAERSVQYALIADPILAASEKSTVLSWLSGQRAGAVPGQDVGTARVWAEVATRPRLRLDQTTSLVALSSSGLAAMLRHQIGEDLGEDEGELTRVPGVLALTAELYESGRGLSLIDALRVARSSLNPQRPHKR